MLKFPNKIKIKILDGFTREVIKIDNIVISLHLFAMKKNDYYLGPFFSDNKGEIVIDKNMLEISADAELQTGLMDYRNVNECSSLVEIKILSEEEIGRLIEGRSLWGIIGREKKLYNSKEELLCKIKSNNNRLIYAQSLRVTWDENIHEVEEYELKTNRKDKELDPES